MYVQLLVRMIIFQKLYVSTFKLYCRVCYNKRQRIPGWGELLVFFVIKHFFNSQLKCTIFFRPDQKKTIFFSWCNTKQFFTIYVIWFFSANHFKFWRFYHIYMIFDKKGFCVEYLEQNWKGCLNNFNFGCMVRSELYKLKGERSEPTSFVKLSFLDQQTSLLIHFMNYFFFTSSWTNCLYSINLLNNLFLPPRN